MRVSAPLFVEAATGLNDDLNGVERAVTFDIPSRGPGRPGGPLSGQVEAYGPSTGISSRWERDSTPT